MNVAERFGSESPLVGMVHLPPLPGSPRFAGSRTELRGRALADAFALVEGGFDALLVENFGDAPYYPDDVPTSTVAEMTAIVREIGIGVECPYGVNVLRNDAEAALSVAAAGGGSFVRVNVHTGARVTDQGVIDGTAHETLRLRDRVDADVAILADVAVKHSAAVGERDVGAVAEETIGRGLADGLVVSGPATGEPADAEVLNTVLDRRDDVDQSVPVFVGSGVTPENVAALRDIADGIIVGTALKQDGETAAPVDPDRAATFVEAAKRGAMTESLVSESVASIAADVGPERDEVLREMDERAEREGFPTVGPEVGGWLTLLARGVDAERIFEFGSGFGYSAYWFAQALDATGEVILTEIDAGRLADAREYFERGDVADRAVFEHGDAIDTITRYDGPFDVVLLDNEKARYVEAFEAVRERLRPGSLVLADNAVTAGAIDSEDVAGLLAGEERPDATDASAGTAEYLAHVRADEDFETSLLPLGEGVAVSVRL